MAGPKDPTSNSRKHSHGETDHEQTSSQPATEDASTIEKFRKSDSDTGSPEVQIALLSDRITHLTEHLKVHKKGPPQPPVAC